jgi:hypothetical protein
MRLKDRNKMPENLMAKSASFERVSAGFFDGPSPSSVVSKTATSYTDDAPVHECERDSKNRRLAELLKKREHSGTATGSASPNPPRGS